MCQCVGQWLGATVSDGILHVSNEWAGQPHSTRVSNTLKQDVHCCVSPLGQQPAVMTCAVFNDVEEQNFITLARCSHSQQVSLQITMAAFFLSPNCHSLAEVSGLHFLLLAANFPPWSRDPLIPRSWASLSLLLFSLFSPPSFHSLCSSHRHRRMHLLWYLCQRPLPEHPRPVSMWVQLWLRAGSHRRQLYRWDLNVTWGWFYMFNVNMSNILSILSLIT